MCPHIIIPCTKFDRAIFRNSTNYNIIRCFQRMTSMTPNFWQVRCSAVIVRSSTFGDGAFAARDINQGECFEWGLVRRLPPGFDGNKNEYIFTWSEDRTVWAMTSGTATFLNTAAPGEANTKVKERWVFRDVFRVWASIK